MSRFGGLGISSLNSMTGTALPAIQSAINSFLQTQQFQQEMQERRKAREAQEKARKDAEKERKKALTTSLAIGGGLALGTAGLGAALAPAAAAAPALGTTVAATETAAAPTIAGTTEALTASTVADAALAAPTAEIGAGIIESGAGVLASSPTAAAAAPGVFNPALAGVVGGTAGAGSYQAMTPQQGAFNPSTGDVGVPVAGPVDPFAQARAPIESAMETHRQTGPQIAAASDQLGVQGADIAQRGRQAVAGGVAGGQDVFNPANYSADSLARAGGYGIQGPGDRLKLFGLLAGKNLANVFAPGSGDSLNFALGAPQFNYQSALNTGVAATNLGLEAGRLAESKRENDRQSADYQERTRMMGARQLGGGGSEFERLYMLSQNDPNDPMIRGRLGILTGTQQKQPGLSDYTSVINAFDRYGMNSDDPTVQAARKGVSNIILGSGGAAGSPDIDSSVQGAGSREEALQILEAGKSGMSEADYMKRRKALGY